MGDINTFASYILTASIPISSRTLRISVDLAIASFMSYL